MIRLFVGLPFPETIRERLAGLCSGLPGARWVKPENLHLSLRFIGEVEEHLAEEIGRDLEAVRAPAFDVTLSGVGTFGQGRKARVLWVGVEPSEALAHLQAKVESAVVRAGIEPEGRRFSPHVTLARFRQAPPGHKLGAFVQGNEPFRAGPIPITGFTLFQSFLGREGAHYEPLADYPLS